MSKKCEFEVVEELGAIGNMKLRKIRWYENEPKFDLRTWWLDEQSGTERCSKGLCFSDDDARELVALLTKYFKGKK